MGKIEKGKSKEVRKQFIGFRVNEQEKRQLKKRFSSWAEIRSYLLKAVNGEEQENKKA